MLRDRNINNPIPLVKFKFVSITCSLTLPVLQSAIDLWWSDCHTTRRTNQTKRKPCRPRSSTPTATSLTSSTTGGESQELDDLTLDSRDCSESDSSSEETALSTILEDWDNLFL